MMGAIEFMVTLDHDGHCEASLCAPFGLLHPDTIKGFFERWGRATPTEPGYPIRDGRGMHWIIENRGKK